MTNVAVILSGCGVYDGAEINEVVLTLLALEEQGATYQTFAPDIQQTHVINHATGEQQPEVRNVLVEANRITRGNTQDLATLSAGAFDALVVPGGFGVAKNLSDFAFTDAEFTINPEIKSVLAAFKLAQKPVGYMCIAPALLSQIYDNCSATIGSDPSTCQRLEAGGIKHVATSVEDIAIDRENKVVTTAAYMLATKASEAKVGIDKLVTAVITLIND